MSTKSNSQVVRFQKGKTKFEILTKKGAALKYRQNKVGLHDVVMIDQIFTKLSQGKVAKTSELERVFGTSNFEECISKILDSGDLNLSSSERTAKTDSKRNEIVYYIVKNYINPLSKLPHPAARIESAINEYKIRIDVTKSTKTQALDAIKKMRGKLFFAKAYSMSIRLSIKYKYDIKQIGVLLSRITGGTSYQQKWNEKGCDYVMEIGKSDLDELTKALNGVTNGGDYDLKVMDQETTSVVGGCSPNSKSKKQRQIGMEKKKIKKKRNKLNRRDVW